jgi:hypothetical protein
MGTIAATSDHIASVYRSSAIDPSAASTSDFIGFENTITRNPGTFNHAGIQASVLTIAVTATGGTLAQAACAKATITVNGSGSTVTDAYLFRGVYTYTAGTLPNLYGMLIPAITGAGANYAIYTNDGIVSIGDTTVSSSITTGAMILSGGLGVAKGAYGKNLNVVQGTITDPTLAVDATVTWSDVTDTFTAWQCNVTNSASGADSLLVALNIGGANKFCVRPNGGAIIGGPTTDGSWEIIVSGTDLLFQRRETGSFVPKYTFSA